MALNFLSLPADTLVMTTSEKVEARVRRGIPQSTRSGFAIPRPPKGELMFEVWGETIDETGLVSAPQLVDQHYDERSAVAIAYDAVRCGFEGVEVREGSRVVHEFG